jgi:hypothetical protein
MKNYEYFVSLRDLQMENAEMDIKENCTKTIGTNQSFGKLRPSSIVLIFEANLIRLQGELRIVVSKELFRNAHCNRDES